MRSPWRIADRQVNKRPRSSGIRVFRVVLCLVAPAALLLSACGGGDASGADNAIAAVDDGDGAAAATTTTVAGTTQDQVLKLTACLREHGLDVQDPTFDADGNLSGGLFGPDSGVNPGEGDFQAAFEACRDLLEGLDLRPGGGGGFDQQAIQDATLEYTECLRDHGLEVDDLDFEAGGPGGGPGAGNRDQGPPGGGSLPPDGAGPGNFDGDPSDRLAELLGLDPDDPTVAAALEACAPILEGIGPGATTTVP